MDTSKKDPVSTRCVWKKSEYKQTFVDTTGRKGGTALGDEDWHALCHAMCFAEDKAEWLEFSWMFVDTNRELQTRHTSASSRAAMLSRTQGMANGDEFYDNYRAQDSKSERCEIRPLAEAQAMARSGVG